VGPRRATIDDVWRKDEDHSLRRLPGAELVAVQAAGYLSPAAEA